MGYTLPITCRQLSYLVLVGLFVIGNILLIQSGYGMEPFNYGFFGWLLVALSSVFGLVALFFYIDDHQLIRCKCEKK